MKNRKNILKEAIVLLVVSLMVLSSLVVTANTTESTTNPQSNTKLIGLAPNILKKEEHQQSVSAGAQGYFFAYDVQTSDICNFTTDAVITNINNQPGIFWLSGADFDSSGNWYAVNYYGNLYMIDTAGNPTLIGNTGITPLNSLVYDSTTGIWYCCGYTGSIDSLFEIDLTTGVATLIGPFGAPNTMISLMCDTAGNMYAYDVVSSGSNSSLYSINKLTGAATKLYSMGHTFCYAQEGKFDRNTGILYLAVYDIGLGGGTSYLATCDPLSGLVTIVNLFIPISTMQEIDALAIPWPQAVPDLIIHPKIPADGYGSIVNNKYEPPNWPPASPAVTQIGKWTFHFGPWYFWFITLQNDNPAVTSSDYTISATKLTTGPFNGYFKLGASPPKPIPGTKTYTSLMIPPGGKLLVVRVFTVSPPVKIGINVISKSGGQDSVIITT